MSINMLHLRPMVNSLEKLYPYGTQKVRKELLVIGKVNLNVISLLTNKSSDVDFYVLDGESKNLLSVNTSVVLGDSCAINTCETDFDQLVTEFSDRFTGIGKMKDTEIKLHIDESVRPIE